MRHDLRHRKFSSVYFREIAQVTVYFYVQRIKRTMPSSLATPLSPDADVHFKYCCKSCNRHSTAKVPITGFETHDGFTCLDCGSECLFSSVTNLHVRVNFETAEDLRKSIALDRERQSQVCKVKSEPCDSPVSKRPRGDSTDQLFEM